MDITVRPGSVVGSTIFEAFTTTEAPTKARTVKSVSISVDNDEDDDPIIDYWDENTYDIAEQAPALFNIPKLESLSMVCFAPSNSLWKGFNPLASSLTELSLSCGEMTEHHLRGILRVTPNFKKLDCHLVYDYDLVSNPGERFSRLCNY